MRPPAGPRRATIQGVISAPPSSTAAVPPTADTEAHRVSGVPTMREDATVTIPSAASTRPVTVTAPATPPSGRRPASAADTGTRATVRAGTQAATVATAIPSRATATTSRGSTSSGPTARSTQASRRGSTTATATTSASATPAYRGESPGDQPLEHRVRRRPAGGTPPAARMPNERSWRRAPTANAATAIMPVTRRTTPAMA